jgi:hypothetical protein
MKISELIEELESRIESDGDIDIGVFDSAIDSWVPIKAVRFEQGRLVKANMFRTLNYLTLET